MVVGREGELDGVAAHETGVGDRDGGVGRQQTPDGFGTSRLAADGALTCRAQRTGLDDRLYPVGPGEGHSRLVDLDALRNHTDTVEPAAMLG